MRARRATRIAEQNGVDGAPLSVAAGTGSAPDAASSSAQISEKQIVCRADSLAAFDDVACGRNKYARAGELAVSDFLGVRRIAKRCKSDTVQCPVFTSVCRFGREPVRIRRRVTGERRPITAPRTARTPDAAPDWEPDLRSRCARLSNGAHTAIFVGVGPARASRITKDRPVRRAAFKTGFGSDASSA
jgi:hypothetical protein